jgi:hypothetical protein
MLHFLLHKDFIKVKYSQGLHCVMRNEADLCFFYVLISRNKGKIEIEKFLKLEGPVNILEGIVKKDIPLFLSIDGKGILSKKVIYNPSRALIQQAIPNAVEDDFIIEQHQGTNGHVFISFARKNGIDELLNSFKEQKFTVLGFSLGPFNSTALINIFDTLPSSLVVDHYRISFYQENKQIQDFERTNGDEIIYDLAGYSLSSSFLSPLTNALSYYIKDDEQIRITSIKDNLEEFASKRLFIFTGWSSLIFVFLTLIINILLYSNYSQQEQQLENQVAGSKELTLTMSKLKEEMEWKEKFLNQAGILKNTRMSLYADQIASILPEGMILEKMEIHPVNSKIKKQKEIELQPDKILIEGIVNNSQIVDKWIDKLKMLNWIEDVYVVNYNKENDSANGVFSLEIRIKNGEK